MKREASGLVPEVIHWDEVKVKAQIMKECVLAKFVQHKDLRLELLGTGDEEIVEESPTDSFWGKRSDGTGRNELGKILMQVRKELKGE